MGELGCAVLILSLGDVVKLMLDQGAELKVAALGAVVSSESDDECRHFAELVTHLLLHPGFLPAACAESYLFGLAQDCAALFLEAR